MTLARVESSRAVFALDCVKNAFESPASKEYKSYCMRIPSLIVANGLAATVAFVFAKKNDKQGNENKKSANSRCEAYKLIYQNIFQYVNNYSGGSITNNNDSALLSYILNLQSAEYRSLTNEIIKLFEWMRRFAEGMIEGEADD